MFEPVNQFNCGSGIDMFCLERKPRERNGGMKISEGQNKMLHQ